VDEDAEFGLVEPGGHGTGVERFPGGQVLLGVRGLDKSDTKQKDYDYGFYRHFKLL